MGSQKQLQYRILSGLFVKNSKLTSVSFHFLLKTQTREFSALNFLIFFHQMRYIITLKKRTAYRKRHLALPSVDRMDIKQIEWCFNYFLLVKATIDSPLPDEMDEMYHDLVKLYTGRCPWICCDQSQTSCSDINEDTCYNRYRFLKPVKTW